LLIASLIGLMAVGAFAADDEKEKEEERTEIRQMVQDTLFTRPNPPPKKQSKKRMGTPSSAIPA